MTIPVIFTDYGNQTHTATINWGDGNVSSIDLQNTNDFSPNHTYTTPGTYTVTITITDNQGATTTKTLTITVNNVPPEVGAIDLPLTPILANTPFNTAVYFTDPGILDTHTAVWEWGDGTTDNGTINETDGSGNAYGTHAYTHSGNYNITVTVTDKDGASGKSTATVYVDAPPTINPIAPVTIDEGDTYTASAYITDPDSTSWTATVDYGDGSGVQPIPVTGTSIPLNHIYNKVGSLQLSIAVTDDQGATSEITVPKPRHGWFTNPGSEDDRSPMHHDGEKIFLCSE